MAGILNWNLGDSSSNVNSNTPTHTYASAGNKTVIVKQGTSVSAADVTGIAMDADDLVGVIDISSFTKLASLKVNSNRKLTSIINPVSASTYTEYWAYDCSLNGILDVSGLTGLGGTFRVNGNKNLTKILNPISSKA